MSSCALPSMFSLEGQTALITGGTRGIGRAMALALAEAGADILLVQRNTTFTETKIAIEKLGRKAGIYEANLSSEESVAALVPSILHDGYRIDILLNCAGVQRRYPSHQFPAQEWNEVLQVNLTTVFTLCRDVGAHMLGQGPNVAGRRGSIINVASLLSFQGGITVPAYAASKGGVSQLTKALSNEWAGKGISVNAIAPGYVATEMNTALMEDADRAQSILGRIPAGRWGTPEDFKGPVLFLASAASQYISGECLVVDGGWMGR
ncbi:2-deoxy-d-gluconate 3-dehydrogenase-like protein [Usnea florida]